MSLRPRQCPYQTCWFDSNSPSGSGIDSGTIASGRSSELAEQRVLARELPNGRIELVENAAHAVFVDDPEQFERLVNRFLAMASD